MGRFVVCTEALPASGYRSHAADGLKAWVYGTTNHVHETNRNVQAWALDAWQYGATGAIDKTTAWISSNLARSLWAADTSAGIGSQN